MTMRLPHYLALAAAGLMCIGTMAGDVRAATANNVKCNGCIGEKDIGNKAISKRLIREEAVNAKAIKKGSVKAKLLNADAKPAGIAYAEEYGAGLGINAGVTIMTKVQLKAPAKGYVRLTGYGTLEYGAQELVYCTLNDAQTYYAPAQYYATGEATVSSRYRPVAMERYFEVGAGIGTYYLLCRTDGGNPVQMLNPRLAAEYTPQKY